MCCLWSGLQEIIFLWGRPGRLVAPHTRWRLEGALSARMPGYLQWQRRLSALEFGGCQQWVATTSVLASPGLPAPFARCLGLSGFRARAWLQPGLVVWVCLSQRTRYNELPLMEVLLHAVKEICLPIAPVLPPIPTFWEPLQRIHNLGLASCSRGEHPELTANIHRAEVALIWTAAANIIAQAVPQQKPWKPVCDFKVITTSFPACTTEQPEWKRRRCHRWISLCYLYRRSPAALRGFPCAVAVPSCLLWVLWYTNAQKTSLNTFASLCHPCSLYCTMLSLKIPSAWNTCPAARVVALPPAQQRDSAQPLLQQSETFTEPAAGYREDGWLATLQVKN